MTSQKHLNCWKEQNTLSVLTVVLLGMHISAFQLQNMKTCNECHTHVIKGTFMFHCGGAAASNLIAVFCP